MWLPLSSCESCICTNKFNPNNSLTYKTDKVEISIPDSPFLVEGWVSNDTIGFASEYSITEQSFISVFKQTRYIGSDDLKADGVLVTYIYIYIYLNI